MLLFPSESSATPPETNPVKPLLCSLLMTTRELDFRGLSLALSHSIGTALSRILNAAPVCSVCFLPGLEIPVTGLKLHRPVTLQGSPGTLLKVAAAIDVAEDGEEGTFTCCEMTMEAAKELRGAIVRVRKSAFELRDCSLLGGGIEAVEAELTVQSCRFSHGKRGVDAHHSSLQVEKCFFSDLGDAGVRLRDCEQAYVEASCFERGAGVVVRLTDLQHSSRLYVEGNTFDRLKSPCVHIEGRVDCLLPASLTLRKNRMIACENDGLFLTHLNLTEMQIIGNSAEDLSGSVCKLQSVQGRLSFDSNSCLQAAGYGLYVLNSSVRVENNQFFQNALGGLLVAQDRDVAVVLSKNVFAGNSEFGICILADSGQVSIEGCHASSNYGCGIRVSSLNGESSCGHVGIHKSQVKGNHGLGVVVSDVRTSITACTVELNDEGDVVSEEVALVASEGAVMPLRPRGGAAGHACVLQ